MANEKRLIDANAKELMNRININFGCVTRFVVKSILEDAPTVDAVEVVRCYKCRHWADHGNGYGRCRHPRFHIENEIDPTTTHNSFCDCGERKVNG